MDVSALGAAHQLRGGRFDLVDDLDRERKRLSVGLGERREPVAGCFRIEEIRGFEQPVAAALHPFQRKAGDLGVLQDLRNAGARQPDLVGQVFARVELAIGELAQQRESQRSEHL